MSALQVSDLSGGYGRLTVFRDVSFSLDRGETVGLLGLNGAGKTTLLKSIVGALPVSSGRIALHGQEVSAEPFYKRARLGLALVPEGRHIFAQLTVRDNLDLVRAVAVTRNTSKPFDRSVTETFELFPRLRERQGQLAGSLSGGEQQMLAVARALLLEPDVLMLDEPTQGLAPIIIQSLGQALAKLKGRFAMLVVEQNRGFLESLTDCIWAMQSGRLVK
jgi:branched-chain amino acid transport system ATP-binding protein